MVYTNHAKVRMQHRGIPPLIVKWLMEYGATEYSAGALKHFFDKRSRKMLSREMGRIVIDRLGDLMNQYIVEKDGVILTVGHRQKHIFRNSKF